MGHQSRIVDHPRRDYSKDGDSGDHGPDDDATTVVHLRGEQ